MNVVHKEVPNQHNPQTREERIVMLKSMEAMAQRVKEKTIGQWFSLPELKVYLRRPISACEQIVSELSQLCLIETDIQNGRKRFRINLDTQWRLQHAEDVKDIFRQSIQGKLDHFTEIASMIREIHPEPKPITNENNSER